MLFTQIPLVSEQVSKRPDVFSQLNTELQGVVQPLHENRVDVDGSRTTISIPDKTFVVKAASGVFAYRESASPLRDDA
jgi:uncharacterized secreted protein with C-terminal beta-propeller domain